MTLKSEYPIHCLVSLGKKLQSLLKAHEMEQLDLAKRLGVAPSSVSDWVNGKTFPRHSRLKGIARVFKVDVSELLA